MPDKKGLVPDLDVILRKIRKRNSPHKKARGSDLDNLSDPGDTAWTSEPPAGLGQGDPPGERTDD
jgi:hypothetical protein